MRFTCTSDQLLSGLAIVTRALPTRSTNSIYEDVLLQSSDDGIRMTCSDGSITIVTTVPATIQDHGAVLLPGKLFYEVVRKMPTSNMTASMNNNSTVAFKCMGSRTTVAGKNADLYPEIAPINAENSFTISQPMLRDMIQQTCFAIATDESRAVLTGSLLELSRGEVRMVALDGFRLAMRLERISEVDHTLKAIIPGKAITEIAKILSDDDGAMANVVIGGSQMMLTIGDTTFYTTLIEGEFIQYQRTLPQQFKTNVIVDRRELAMCVDRAALMARESKSNLIRISVGEQGLIITSNSEIGDVYEELFANVEGDTLDIAFNVKYLTDMLRVITDEQLMMCLNTSVTPCLVKSVSGDSYTYLVLPVRVHV